MKAKRRQELKQDDFVDTLMWFWQTFKAHQQEIITGGVVALVLAALVMIVVPKWIHANDNAWATLASTDEAAAEARYPMPGKPAEGMDAQIKNYEKVAADYPRSGAAPLALYKAGKLLHEEQKLDEALKKFDDILSGYPKSDTAPAAEAAKASVLEDKGKFAEAKALYEKVAESGPKYLAPECYLNAARCADMDKDAVQAKALYEKVIMQAPGTEWAQIADERLQSQAKAKPAPPPAKPEKKG